MLVRIIIVCLISFAAVYPQKIDERLLLIEAQKLIKYMESFDEMTNNYTDGFIVSNITNVAQSVSRSMNILFKGQKIKTQWDITYTSNFLNYQDY
jgi:hypothetical protein